jgi:hypothetical protein
MLESVQEEGVQVVSVAAVSVSSWRHRQILQETEGRVS